MSTDRYRWIIRPSLRCTPIRVINTQRAHAPDPHETRLSSVQYRYQHTGWWTRPTHRKIECLRQDRLLHTVNTSLLHTGHMCGVVNLVSIKPSSARTGVPITRFGAQDDQAGIDQRSFHTEREIIVLFLLSFSRRFNGFFALKTCQKKKSREPDCQGVSPSKGQLFIFVSGTLEKIANGVRHYR